MNAEIVSVVDANDAVIGTAPRPELRQRRAIYRVTYILVFNSAGEILVQRRTDSKDQYPGLLDFAAGGVVGAGESYEDCAARELAEELGIRPLLVRQFDMWFEDADSAAAAATAAPPKRTWGRAFTCQHDGDFTLQPSEVVSVEFMLPQTALRLPTTTVTPDSRQVLLAHLL